MKKISVIIPCFNEEKGVGKVIDGIPVQKLLKMGYETEIIAIDNNSRDKTTEVAKEHGAIVLFEKKQGKVAAMKKGFKAAKGEILVTIDGDNTYPSHEIPTLMRAFDGNDLVVGSRFNSIWNLPRIFKPTELPFQRVIANKIGAELGSIILGHRITDVTTGLRAFRSNLLDKIPPIKAQNLDFEAELTARTIACGLKYKEVRITSNAREGHSSLNYFRDAFRFLWAMIVGRYNLGFNIPNNRVNHSFSAKLSKKIKKVSIIILTKNAGDSFRQVLDSIFAQKLNILEVIIIDSASTDNTLKIARNYPVEIVKIQEEDFGHGKTRNLGARLARGSHVVFLTQDAVPSNASWLEEMMKPFTNSRIVGVYGRQIPRENENILDKFFNLSLYSDSDIFWVNSNKAGVDTIFSDVNSAIRRDILLKYPFNDDIIVSEDHEWAHRMLKNGYGIYYNSNACVIHSHSYNLLSLFKRHFDIGVSYNDIDVNRTTLNLLKKGILVHFSELSYIINNGYYYLIPYCIFKDFTKLIALTFGRNEKYFPKYLKVRFSNYRNYWA